MLQAINPDGARADSPTMSRSALLAFVLCSVAMIAEGFDTYGVGYVGPALVKEWGLSHAVVGQLYAVGVVASLFGTLGLGALSDWIGRKWLLVAATIGFGLATVWSAMAPNLHVLMISRFLAGLGLGASVPCAMALASSQTPARFRATVPVLMSACIGLGSVVAGLSAAAVMPRFGWRGIMYVGAVFPILVAVLMAPLLTESRALAAAVVGPVRVVRPPWRDLLRPRMLLIILTVTLGLIANYTVTFFFGFWLPTLVASAATDVRTVGLATALIKTASVFGSVTLGVLMDRFGVRRTLPFAFVAAAIVLVATVNDSHQLAALVLSLGVASFFLDGAFSGIIGFGAIVFPPSIRGSGIGITVSIGRLLGGTFGPMLGGVLLGRGLPVKAVCAVFAGPLLVAAVMVALAAWLSERENRPA